MKNGRNYTFWALFGDLYRYNLSLLLMRPNDIYKFKALLPEDYCLIPGNGAIKLVDLD